jgi:transposase
MRPEVRMARYIEGLERYRAGRLSCGEAAELLGISERHFWRLRERYEAEGAEGLIDRRRGRVSGRRAAVDRIEFVVEQYRTRYWDFTVKHFHEALVAEHRFRLGYTWTKAVLQSHGLVRVAAKRSAHRKKGPRRPLPGMMLFQSLPRRRPGTVRPTRGWPVSRARPGRHVGRCHQRDLLGPSG